MEQKKSHVVIPNSLADVVLLVGIDDSTGLTPFDENVDVNVFDALYELQYEPRVISAISAMDMVNFTPFTHRVESYPPAFKKEALEVHQAEEMFHHRDRMFSEYDLGNKKSMSFHPSKLNRSVSVSSKLLRTMSVVRHPGNGGTLPTIPELPVSDEVINSISSFCFPDGLKVYERKPENTSHFFVLTNISGHRTYATCVTFFQVFLADKDSAGNIYLTHDDGGADHVENGQLRCYIPQCCVAISKYPYYTTLKECLSSMLMYIEKDPEEIVTFLKDYANIMTHTPVPPAGNIAVNFCVYNMPVTILPPTHPDKPVIDLPLHLTLSCFQAEEFLKVLTCILLEEKIVFLCSNYSLLTIVMESLMHLILPFKWRFTYSTILPSAALGFLEAPGIFMYGVHHRHKGQVEQVDDLVLVDIDEGTVYFTLPDSHLKVRNGTEERIKVLNIPVAMAKAFTNKWSKLQPRFDLDDTRRPFCYNMEQHRQFQMRRVRDQNFVISSACLELMVNLYKEVVGMLRVEHNHFNKEQFLQEHSADRKFYEKVFKTDMFKIFLRDRIKEKPDYWSDLEMKSRGYGQTKTTYHNKPRRYTLSHITPGDNREITLFCLQDIKDLKIHVKNTLKQITKAIEVSTDHDNWTSLLHLKALYQCGDGNKMAAMDDFIKLSTAKSRILPTNVLSDLYNNQMTEEEKLLFKKKQGHELLLDFIENDFEGQERARIRMDPIEIPDSDLNFFQFYDFVSLKQMSDDHKTIELLFEALTQESFTKTAEIKQMTFQMFVLCWEENRRDCQQLLPKAINLPDEEIILKISKYIIKTDFGLGRIFLTNKRLFFMSDVSNKFKEITLIRDIKALEKSECSSLFSKVPTLKILRRNANPFTVHLKDERNWWYMVIYEMWAGKVMAEAMKDVMMIHYAVQTTLLVDAIIASGQEDCTTHSEKVDSAAEMLCLYSGMLKKEKHILPQETREALQRKIDVNMGEKDSKTVQSLLYTGGGETTSPRLWCGLTDGRIKIFNAISWLAESEISLNYNQVVACLTDVGGNQVWAGAYGIYIIDSLTLTSTKTLLDHADLVVSIVVYNERSVYTASLDGTIIKWNIQRLTHTNKIKLTNIKSLRVLKIFNDRLICGSWSNIQICDLEGSVLSVLEARENNQVIEIDSYTVTLHGQVWAGGRRLGKVYMWDLSTGEYKQCITIDNCRGISSMEDVDGRIWIGTKDGIIYVYTVNDRKLWKTLKGHDDAVRVQCCVKDRYMISGGGSKDGRVCIWRATTDQQDLSQFLLNSDEQRTKCCHF